MVSGDLWAGAETQVATLASYLIQQPEVKLTVVLLNDRWLARELRQLGVNVVVVDEHQNSACAIVRFLIRFFKEHDVEIVHTHRYKESILGTLAAKVARVPHVVRTVHLGKYDSIPWSRTCGRDRLKSIAYGMLDQAMLSCFADDIVTVSRGMADALKRSMYGARVRPIHNGVDLRKVKATRTPREVRDELGIGSDELVIGTAGRLSPVKGHSFLIRAAKLVLEHQSRARFLFVGSGPLKQDLLAAAADLGIDRHCLFIDRIADLKASIYDVIATMDIFALPSLDEGIPIALLEAMALGRPAVATAVGGVPEVITDGVTGVLIRPRDHRALAGACLELACDRNWAQALGVRGRRTVEQAFSRETNGQAVLDLYRGITPQHAKAAPGVGALALFTAPVRALVALGRQRLDRIVERRRMHQIRQDPKTLIERLHAATNILVACRGNIIRSAFAAHLVARAPDENRAVSVCSAGFEAVEGRPCFPAAVTAAVAHGVDLSQHAAAAVSPEAVAAADVIFVMDVAQLAIMRRRFPRARARTFLLTSLAPDQPLEVHDPADGHGPSLSVCFAQIAAAVRPIARTLSDGTR